MDQQPSCFIFDVHHNLKTRNAMINDWTQEFSPCGYAHIPCPSHFSDVSDALGRVEQKNKAKTSSVFFVETPVA